MNQKIVVVGGGTGSATAWHLQRGGAEVSVVERHGVAAGVVGNAGSRPPSRPCLSLRSWRPGSALLSPKSRSRAAAARSAAARVPRRSRPALHGPAVARRAAGLHRGERLRAGRLRRARHGDRRRGRGADPVGDPDAGGLRPETDREVLLDEFRRVNSDGGRTDYALLDDAAVRELEPALGPGVRCGLRIDGQRFINPGRFVHSSPTR
ncbi:FAD-binding oxidoreductase [Pseudonocardia sp. MCCB 268]|nr:FAD-binding oxidoreductase [Pseudonocardia cytotoxica]